ncbi:MAG TPA: glycosyltransferase family 39 protein, partial [Anaerolineae bacterium]
MKWVLAEPRSDRRSNLAQHWPVIAILVAFLVLATLYSILDPVFEASDELTHYPVVAYIAQGSGLPVQRPGQETLWLQEGSQPPLYYLLSAALTSWIKADDLVATRWINPHALIGKPLAVDNKNMVIHTGREAFPWRGTTLAIHLIRFFSILLSAGTVLCTYALARVLFPARRSFALAAMAVNAFLPMFLFIGASVNNDNLVSFLSSLALLLLARLVLSGPKRRGRAPWVLVGLGILLGLACLSKLSGLALLPLACLALLLWRWTTWRRRGKSRFAAELGGYLADCALVLLPAFLVAGWWYVRNVRLYGDPTGLNVMLAIAGARPEAAGLRELLAEFQGFRISFWGLFGGVNVLMRPAWIYYLLDAMTLLAAAGIVLAAIRAWRDRSLPNWPVIVLAVAWVVVEFVALVRWTSVTQASQGRLMFPAISVLCLGLVVGSASLARGWSRPVATWALPALLLILAVASPFTAMRPAYAAAAIGTPAGLPASAQRFDVDYGGVARLLGFELDREHIRAGDKLKVTLYWQTLARPTENYSIYLQVFGWHQDLGQRDSYPGGGAYPTSLWTPGQMIRDTFEVPITATARGPAPAWVSAGLYRLSTKEKLPAKDAHGSPVIFPLLAKISLDASAPTLVPAHGLTANLENRVRLLGYDLPQPAVKPGSDLEITLFWQDTAKLDRDYSAFVHL